MRNAAVVLLVMVLLNVAVYRATYIQHINQGVASTPISMPAPDFTWRTFDGKTGALKSLTGHVVALHFWASWCAPCRAEFPKLLTAAATTQKDVIFLTLSSDESRESAEAFIHDAQKTAQVGNLPNVIFAFDPDRKITFDVFQTAIYPETILLDPALNMRRKFPGVVGWQNAAVQNIFKELGRAAKP